MKNTVLILTICLSAGVPLFAQDTNQLTDPKSRVSYAIGMMTGRQWKQQEVEFDPDVYVRGIKDALAGAPLLTPEQAQQAIDAYRKEYMAKMQQKRLEQATANKTIGEAFLATNKSMPGIKTLSVTLPDGKTSELQYLVLTNGAGPKPTATDTVNVNYRGTLIDGTEFDSSYKRGQPTTFPVTGVIKGWTEALQLMPTGSKWQLFIPSDLAYGEQGRPSIPPNSTLIFEVELVSIKPPEPPKAPEQPKAPAPTKKP